MHIVIRPHPQTIDVNKVPSSVNYCPVYGDSRMVLRIQDIESADLHTGTAGWKTGVRVLGVAESFQRSDKRSFVAGVVMRGDLRIDGYGFCRPDIGGRNATQELLAMYDRINRRDIRAWMLGGSVISWFNVVDLRRLHESTSLPVTCVSYHSSEGIEKYLQEYFPTDWQERNAALEQSSPRARVELSSGHPVFLSVEGLSLERGLRLVDMFTVDGGIPEPIRVARILASSMRNSGYV